MTGVSPPFVTEGRWGAVAGSMHGVRPPQPAPVTKTGGRVGRQVSDENWQGEPNKPQKLRRLHFRNGLWSIINPTKDSPPVMHVHRSTHPLGLYLWDPVCKALQLTTHTRSPSSSCELHTGKGSAPHKRREATLAAPAPKATQLRASNLKPLSAYLFRACNQNHSAQGISLEATLLRTRTAQLTLSGWAMMRVTQLC